MIVTFDHHQDVPATSYVGDRETLRLVAPDPPFWGTQLVGPRDMMGSDELRRALECGVGVIGNDPAPWLLRPELAGADLRVS